MCQRENALFFGNTQDKLRLDHPKHKIMNQPSNVRVHNRSFSFRMCVVGPKLHDWLGQSQQIQPFPVKARRLALAGSHPLTVLYCPHDNNW